MFSIILLTLERRYQWNMIPKKDMRDIATHLKYDKGDDGYINDWYFLLFNSYTTYL